MSGVAGLGLRFYSPLPEQTPLNAGTLLLDAETGISFTTNTDVGLAGLEVTFSPRIVASAVTARQLAGLRTLGHVELVAGGDIVLWDGQIEELEGLNVPSRLTANGYGVDALAYSVFTKQDTDTRSSGQIVADAVAQAAPLIQLSGDPGVFRDPGVRHTNKEFYGKTPADILGQVVKEGGVDGNRWWAAVWPGRALHLLPLIPPPVPDYTVSYQPGRVDLSRQAGPICSHVEVTYKDAQSGINGRIPQAVSPTFRGTFGSRVILAKIDGGTMSADAARRFRDAYLATYDHEQYSGSITLGGGDALERTQGGATPGYLVRAGQWVRVRDLDRPLVILDTNWSAEDGGTLQATLGTPGAPESNLLRSYDAQLAALGKGLVPVTNAPRG